MDKRQAEVANIQNVSELEAHINPNSQTFSDMAKMPMS